MPCAAARNSAGVLRATRDAIYPKHVLRRLRRLMASSTIDGGSEREKKHANRIADGKYDFLTRKQAKQAVQDISSLDIFPSDIYPARTIALPAYYIPPAVKAKI